MYNITLTIIALVLCFSTLIIIEKIFKKEGVYVFIAVAGILANIAVTKNIELFGMVFTLGNIAFASTFLATDILTEKYGKKEAKKGIYMGLLAIILFSIGMQIVLLFTPSEVDTISKSLKEVFSVNLRVSISSLTMYLIANISAIYIYSYLKNKIPGKLWLRNNVSTIITNTIENFGFVFLAFFAVYDLKILIEIALTTTLIEVIIALLDTPFIYISKKLK